MPPLSFVTVDVFTTDRFRGNPLAIVRLDHGHDVTEEQMQSIATEFNLSETVFIVERHRGSDEIPEWRLKIFTVSAELSFAGHPTVGSACYALGTLANNASKGRLVCNAGPIEIAYAEGVAKALIPHNIHLHQQSTFTLEQLYELQPSLKDASRPRAMEVVSPVVGMNFICIELQDLQTLTRVEVSGAKPRAKLDPGWDTGFVGSYFYVLPDGMMEHTSSISIRARMLQSTMEDPATGSAACGLSAYLTLKQKRRRLHFSVTQGVEMGRRSDIGVTVTLKESLDAVERMELSGSAIKVMEGTLESR